MNSFQLSTHWNTRSLLGALLVLIMTLAAPGSAKAQPGNDGPCSPTALTVGGACSNGTVQNATASIVAAPSCGNGNNDVWYTVVVPASGNVTLTTTAGTLTDAGMAIYTVSGLCTNAGSFTQIACNDDQSATDQMPLLTVSCRTPATVLYVRVWKQSGNNTKRTFTICATNPGANPGNDDPCGATNLTVGTSCTNTVSSNANACNSSVASPACAGYVGGDVWLKFTVPGSGTLTVTTDVVAGSNMSDGGMAIYSATNCANPATFTLLACDDNSGPGNMPMITLAGQTPGNVLYIRFWDNGGDVYGQFNICVTTPPAPANDDPCSATSLTASTSCSNTTATNIGATTTPGAGIPVPGCAAYTGNDVWFSVVVPTGGTLTATTDVVAASALVDGGLAIYSAASCAGPFTLLGCDDNNGPGNMSALTLTGQTVGATLWIRVWSNSNATSGQFNICITYPLPPPPNDDPCGALALTAGTSCSNTMGTNQSATSSTGIPAPGCASYVANDVWYSVVVPASGTLTVTTDVVAASALTDGGLAIYSAASCAGPFTLLACDDNNGPGNMSAITLGSQTVGATLWIRVWSNNNATVGQFNICVTTPPAPANDNPCGATALTLGTGCSNAVSTTLGATTTPGAGIPVPGCASYAGNDVWFSVVVPAGGTLTATTDVVAASALTDGGLAFYSAASCAGPFTLLGCDDNSGPGNMSSVTLTGQTVGATLWIRVWSYGNTTSGQFNICTTYPLPNDDPCGATSLTVGFSCSNTIGTNAGATNTPTAGIPAPGCANYAGSDAWFSAIVPASGTLTVTTDVVAASALTDGGMAIYSAASCAGPFTLLGCNDNGGPGFMSALTLSGQTAGATLWIRIWSNNNTASGQFNICATTPPPPPANDNVCSATSLTVGTTCSSVAATNVSATNSATTPAPNCGGWGGTSADVWFSFVAPSSGCAVIQPNAGTLTDGAMALYSATSCAGPFTFIDCDDNTGTGNMPLLEHCDLVPGQTYYIRFWGNGNATGTFDICVYAPALPGSSCAYALEMFDSAENGWGGSTVGISINGSAYTNYTVTAGFNLVMIPVNIGNIISVNYTAVGGFQDEISYMIRQVPGGNGVHASGNTPTTGVVFTETADCVTPPAPPQDCVGGITVCGNRAINENTHSTGFVKDLSTSNRGCLGSNERQGSWVHFSPTTSGTIGFTITPNNINDDYDFAVWGPTATVSCAPPTTPLRCSYSGQTGATGCGNGAADLTEGAGGNKWVSTFNVIAGEKYSMYISNYSQSGLACLLSWQFTNGASLNCTVLPVELLGIDAEVNTHGIDVVWSTATELNNDHFDVERSSDGMEFTRIGTVAGAGTTLERTEYIFSDDAPMTGLNYYRLKQVDTDGKNEYSPVVSEVFRREGQAPMLFPNPTQGILYSAFDMPMDGAAQWTVLDASGRIIMANSISMARGAQVLELPTSSLAPGAYQLQWQLPDGSYLQTARFIKE